MSWLAIVLFGAGSYLLKATGPLLLGERAPSYLSRVAELVTPALLAALIAIQTFTDGHDLVIDERAAGLGAAIVAILLRAPFVVVLVVAAGTTAALRAL